MLIMTSIIRLGKTDLNSKIDEDSHDRILLNLRVISTNNSSMKEIFLVDCRNAYKQLIETENIDLIKKSNIDKLKVSGQVDDLVSFRHLTFKKALGGGADTFDMDLTRATGTTATQDENINKLNRIIQLTGFSDAVYAEAYVNVHQYDILLDVLVVNQTNETMQNLTLEFSTLGDLKLVERPAPYTLRAHGFHTIKANIKVSSTETGVIFGNIVYDGTGASDMSCIILNDIHIDIMVIFN